MSGDTLRDDPNAPWNAIEQKEEKTINKYDYIGTYSDKKYHFLDPHPDEIVFEDIATALSNTCRYSGHVKRFYSVAEHSVHVSRLVYRDTGRAKEALSALMHDASEAYLTDVPRPIKPHLEGYGDIELKAHKVIFCKYNLEPLSEYTHWVDTHIVRGEAEQLFNKVPSWASDYEETGVVVECWKPRQAQNKFTLMFEDLCSMVREEEKRDAGQ